MNLTDEQADAVYTILVEECGVVSGRVGTHSSTHRCETDGASWIITLVNMGNGMYSAACYSDDETPSRLAMVVRANQRIAELISKGVAT